MLRVFWSIPERYFVSDHTDCIFLYEERVNEKMSGSQGSVDVQKFGTPPEYNITFTLFINFVVLIAVFTVIQPPFVMNGKNMRKTLIVVLAAILTYLVMPASTAAEFKHHMMSLFKRSKRSADKKIPEIQPGYRGSERGYPDSETSIRSRHQSERG